jgi:hypothetical protein
MGSPTTQGTGRQFECGMQAGKDRAGAAAADAMRAGARKTAQLRWLAHTQQESWRGKGPARCWEHHTNVVLPHPASCQVLRSALCARGPKVAVEGWPAGRGARAVRAKVQQEMDGQGALSAQWGRSGGRRPPGARPLMLGATGQAGAHARAGALRCAVLCCAQLRCAALPALTCTPDWRP